MIRTIGILGGGQLGRMLCLAAKRMGYRVVTLEPLPDSPCGQVADEQIVAAYDDERAIGELGARTDVVTYEFENIPLGSVRALETSHRIVRPSGEVLRVTQDRLLEKAFVEDCGGRVAPYARVASEAELIAAMRGVGFPAVMKTARGGYDGKGQAFVENETEARAAFSAARGATLIYEGFVAMDLEVSMICARGTDGMAITFPITENRYDRGVLALTIAPAAIPESVAERIRTISRTIGERLAIVGAYCVEFFLAGDDIFVNEIAPRVHNSGHYSLDATQISQHEAHVRAICELPLVEPFLFAPAVMVNVLGSDTGDELLGVSELLRDRNLKLHVYGKQHAALRRKMAHFTVLGSSREDALARAERGSEQISWGER